MILPASQASAPPRVAPPAGSPTLAGPPPPSADVAPTPRQERQAYRAALAELREQYKSELEPTIKMLVAIRDDEDTPAKERINAAKELARWLGVSKVGEEKAPAPSPSSNPQSQSAATYTLSDKERERISALVNGLPS